MFLDVIRTPGLAHLSYVIGDGSDAAVIDPRVDCAEYLDCARRHRARITTIYETHRNEDIVSGARALAAATGASVLHGEALDFAYGEAAADGAERRLGKLLTKVLHTPGHTDESISIACYDTDYGAAAVGVFTGDALFVGDVGRTDFYPERAEEVAGLLYDSIFDRLLPLGDQALLYPAHGAGSACGDDMASREFSSLGHERRCNPMLQLSRSEFVRRKVAEEHTKPPYFREMERRNLAGAESLEGLPRPPLSTAHGLEAALGGGAHVVDVRSPEAYAGCSIPGTLALPLDMLSTWAGWFLHYDRPLFLIADDDHSVDEAVRQLVRLGYTRFAGSLPHGVASWTTGGRALQSIPAVSADDVRRRLARDERFTVLDVRKPSEWRAGHLPGAAHCFLGALPELDGIAELPKPIVTICGTGRRALVAASLLRRMGHEHIETCFGSMQACQAIGCAIDAEGDDA